MDRFAALNEGESEPEPEPEPMSARAAELLLDALVAGGHLEVEGGSPSANLVGAVKAVLDKATNPYRVSERLSALLIDHPAVIDLYASDAEILEVLGSLGSG